MKKLLLAVGGVLLIISLYNLFSIPQLSGPFSESAPAHFAAYWRPSSSFFSDEEISAIIFFAVSFSFFMVVLFLNFYKKRNKSI